MNPFDVIHLQMQTQIIIDLCVGGQADPHRLYEYLETLTQEQRKIACRLVQKHLEQRL
jgi:hypothetical protein